MGMELTPKQQAFVAEYLVDLNATQAAIRAGYSPKNADKIGPELLGKTRVAAAIAEAQEQRAERTQIGVDAVLRELARIGFSDVSNYAMGENGGIELTEGAPPDAMRAVSSVKRKMRIIPREDGEPIVEHELEFRLWDKNSALEKIAKHLGMFIDRHRHEHSGPGGGPIDARVLLYIPDNGRRVG